MSRKWLLLIVTIAVLYGAWHHWSRRAVDHAPGVLVPDAPVQGALDAPVTFDRDGYTITAKASYAIEARILSRESYHIDREADLSPVDFALGWGPMSDTAVLDQMKISQSGRFYYVHWSTKPPVAESVMISHSANTHLVPATSRVADALDAMRPGQVVELRGYLVDVRAKDGWHWNSSLTRTDSGAGACELLWVESASVVHP